jgi:hypothetical protein
MADNYQTIIYSRNVLEFVTVATEYCAFVENPPVPEKAVFTDKMLKLLTVVYLKALLLPTVNQINAEGNEKFVTELDWNYVKENIEKILGDDDLYLDYFDDDMKETHEPVTSIISENLADIYQDLKDFITVYQLAITDLMNDALYECIDNFQNLWGSRLVNSLRILHHIYYTTMK